jgi:phenylpropionate dioxygenase-like ring-hydroxylating dioxygenase large terminal subunit
MSTWNSAAASHWLVAARSDKVGQRPLAITIMDRPLVLARDGAGQLLVLEDRCPHRQVPLSQGRMTAEGLACPYHGWTFGAGGKCTGVPGLVPGTPLPRVAARPVQAVELDGMVWVRQAQEGSTAPPPLIAALAPGSRRFLWQTRWEAHVVDAMENFLDPMHTHMLHPGLVRAGRSQRQTMNAELVELADGFVVDYTGQPKQSGLLYRLFESPRISERAYFSHPGTAQIEYRYQNGSAVRITLHFTPESADRTHVFTTLHVENRWAPAWAVRLFVWPFLRRVARQDEAMLALQTANLKHFPGSGHYPDPYSLVRPYLEKFWNPLPATEPLAQRKTIAIYL